MNILSRNIDATLADTIAYQDRWGRNPGMKLSFGTQRMLPCVTERGRTQLTADTLVETLSAECICKYFHIVLYAF